MSKIAETVEEQMEHWKVLNNKTRTGDLKNRPKDLIIGHALCEVAMQADAKAIFSLSAHGNTPKAIASYRPYCDIYAITPNARTARQMNLFWGVTPIFVDKDYADQKIANGINIAKSHNCVAIGDVAIIGGSDTYDQHNKIAFRDYKSIGGICIL